MLKWIQSLAIFASVVSVLLLAPQIARADDPPGAKLFATYCAACHGAAGKGGGAPAIGSGKYLSSQDDAAITRIASEGNVSKGMPAWSKAKGGALTDDQIASIVAYLRSLATATAPAPGAAPQALASGAPIRTKLAVSQSADADGGIAINATLRDNAGNPVPNASLVFIRQTTWGLVEMGTAKTRADGIATFALSEVPLSTRDVAIVYKGDNKFDGIATSITLEPQIQLVATSNGIGTNGIQLSLNEPLLPPEGSLITPNPPLLPTVLIVLIVGCIWATYGYVLSQVYGILKHGGNKSGNNTFQNRGR